MTANECQALNFLCYTKIMRRRRKFFPFLIFGILFFFSLVFLIFFYSPNSYLTIGTLTVSTTILFFLLLFLFCSLISFYIFLNIRRGIFIGMCVVGYFLLRMLDLSHPVYVLLLIILFVVLELLFRKRS